MKTNSERILLMYNEPQAKHIYDIPFCGWVIRYKTVHSTLGAFATDPYQRYLCVLVHDFVYLLAANGCDEPLILAADQFDIPYSVKWVAQGFLIDFEMGFDYVTPHDGKGRHYNVDESNFELDYLDQKELGVTILGESGKVVERHVVNLDQLPESYNTTQFMRVYPYQENKPK